MMRFIDPDNKDLLGVNVVISISLFPQNTFWLRQEQKHEDEIIGNQ
jgi:uncharacterized membrane protein